MPRQALSLVSLWFPSDGLVDLDTSASIFLRLCSYAPVISRSGRDRDAGPFVSAGGAGVLVLGLGCLRRNVSYTVRSLGRSADAGGKEVKT